MQEPLIYRGRPDIYNVSRILNTMRDAHEVYGDVILTDIIFKAPGSQGYGDPLGIWWTIGFKGTHSETGEPFSCVAQVNSEKQTVCFIPGHLYTGFSKFLNEHIEKHSYPL